MSTSVDCSYWPCYSIRVPIFLPPLPAGIVLPLGGCIRKGKSRCEGIEHGAILNFDPLASEGAATRALGVSGSTPCLHYYEPGRYVR